MLELGKCYLFHTHLGIWIGRVTKVQPEEVMLDRCSWIPDQGRMGSCVRGGSLAGEFMAPGNLDGIAWNDDAVSDELYFGQDR